MKRTRLFLAVCAIALTACMPTACGGSSDSSAASAADAIPTDGLLGELPKVVAEYEASEAAASAKYDELKKSDPDKARAFWTEYLNQGNATKFKKETLPAVEKTLAGKEIPAERAVDMPLRLSGNFVLDDKRNAKVEATFTAGAANDTKIQTLQTVAIDTDGNAIAIPGKGINFSDYPIKEGKKCSFSAFISVKDYDAARWARLQKFVIMDRESEAYKQAEAQIKAGKEAFKNQGKEE